MELLLKSISEHYGKTVQIIKEFPTGNYGMTMKVSLDDELCVMKMIPSSDRSKLDHILPFQYFINKHGLNVPCPLKTINGTWFFETIYEGKTMLVYVYPLLTGENLENSIEDSISKGLLKSLGKEVAKLHQVMSDYPKSELKHFRPWDVGEGLFVIYEEINKDIPQVLIDIYEKSRADFKQLNLPMNQTIHGDMHFANILYDSTLESLEFIDLEDCVMGSSIMDIAILCFDLPIVCPSVESTSAGIADIIEGYEALCPLTKEEKQALPILLKMLETASYVNCYGYRDMPDPWLSRFFDGREKNILSGRDYLTK